MKVNAYSRKLPDGSVEKTIFDNTHTTQIMKRMVDDVLHCLGHPAFIESIGDQVLKIKFFSNGVLHRDPSHGPSSISFHDNGRRSDEAYLLTGLMHRDLDKGPAYIEYDYDGKPTYEEYWLCGKLIKTNTLFLLD